MRVVNRATLYPYKCSVTGRDDGMMMDMGVTIPAGRDWRLYLRQPVLEDAAKRLKMVPQAEADEIKVERDRLKTENRELEKALGAFEEAQAALRKLK